MSEAAIRADERERTLREVREKVTTLEDWDPVWVKRADVLALLAPDEMISVSRAEIERLIRYAHDAALSSSLPTEQGRWADAEALLRALLPAPPTLLEAAKAVVSRDYGYSGPGRIDAKEGIIVNIDDHRALRVAVAREEAK